MEDLVGSSRNSSDQEETSRMMATDSKPTEWTDAKHSLFLKSIEATFVDQLYESLNLFHKKYPFESKTSKHNKNTIHKSFGEDPRCLQRRGIRKFQASRPRTPLTTTDNQDSAESNTEVTGQNFVDENLQADKSSKKIHGRKRTRISTNKVSFNDQVVPRGNIVR